MLMPPASAPTTPLLLLLGAQGSGAPALASALQSQWAESGVTLRVWEEPCGRGDDEGLAAALQATGAAEWTLLMGLDLPCPDDQRAAQETADARLRAALAAAGRSYRVVYGSTPAARLAQAMQAVFTIKTIANSALGTGGRGRFDPKSDPPPDRPARLRAWSCEKCSDPECEHRLFTALTGTRNGSGSGA